MSLPMISYFLQSILIIVTIIILRSKDKIKMVVLFSMFSLIIASLYYFNNAPDVALSEGAIGSAIIPLLFIISISKQDEFVVISKINDDFLNNNDVFKGQGYKILEQFTDHYGLTLKIYNNRFDNLKGIFRKSNVDLIVQSCPITNKYIFKGKESSILMNKLKQITEGYSNITVLTVKEGETDD